MLAKDNGARNPGDWRRKAANFVRISITLLLPWKGLLCGNPNVDGMNCLLRLLFAMVWCTRQSEGFGIVHSSSERFGGFQAFLTSSNGESSTSSDVATETSSTATDIIDAAPSSAANTKFKRARRKKKGLPRKAQAHQREEQLGQMANVNWRRVPMSALRHHPRFAPLPPAQFTTTKEPTLAQAASFRQDTWRWDMLHQGRLTGRFAAAALGFFDAPAAARLKVPPTLRNPMRAVEAAAYLSKSFETEALETIFCDDDEDERDDDCICHDWIEQDDGQWRIREPRSVVLGVRSPLRARLVWGKAQEACGITAAIEYVSTKFGDDAVVAETGMCAGDVPSLAALAEAWRTTAPPWAVSLLPRGAQSSARRTKLLLGASPDGFVAMKGGSVEVLEIKSVCPFAACKDGRMTFRDRGPASSLAPWIVPQLMLSMYCAGDACQAALVASVSATRGANFFRIRRDDAYISTMLIFFEHFHFCCVVGTLPPTAIDYTAVGDYNAFLDATITIAHSAKPTNVPVVYRPEDKSPTFLDRSHSQPRIDDRDHSGEDACPGASRQRTSCAEFASGAKRVSTRPPGSMTMPFQRRKKRRNRKR